MNDLKFIFAFGWPYLRRYKRRFILGIILGIIFGLFQASFLWLTQTLTERIAPESIHVESSINAAKPSSLDSFPLAKKIQDSAKMAIKTVNDFTLSVLDPWLPMKGRSLDWRQILGGLMIIPLLMAVRGMISFGSSYELRWVNEKVMNDLRCDVLKKLNSLSMDYFNRSTVGDMTTRINSDTALLHQALYLGISDLIKEPFTVIAVVSFLIGMNAKLALIALVFLPLCIIPIAVLGKKVRKASAKTVTHYVAASSMLIEALNNIRAVKAFGVESKQEEEFARHNDAFVKHSIRRTRAAELVNPFVEVISSLGIGVIVIYIVYAHLNITDLATLIAGIVLLATPVKKIANLNMLFQRARIGVERLRDIFSEKPSVTDKADAIALPPFNRAIQLDSISFSYKDRTILHDLSLIIPKGKKIGIAGESGSGKSTLINLIYRFYDVKSGSIRIDGYDLRDVSSISFRSQMALVSQEVLLFNRSVADNIRIGKSDATLEEIIHAAKEASAHDFIMQMSQGYDTIIGEHGVQLSGGQRQRLSIARAFVRKAPILLLDEATASLDSKAESEIQGTIDRLAEDKTVISIAHRLSTLSNCDEIVVIKEGRIVEQGSFQQLLASHGHFREMARKQGLVDSY